MKLENINIYKLQKKRLGNSNSHHITILIQLEYHYLLANELNQVISLSKPKLIELIISIIYEIRKH